MIRRPEERNYVVTLSNGVSVFQKDDCMDSMKTHFGSRDRTEKINYEVEAMLVIYLYQWRL